MTEREKLYLMRFLRIDEQKCSLSAGAQAGFLLGVAYERLRREMSSAAGASQARVRRGVLGYSPPENLEEIGHLRPHFVRFEDSLLGNKPYKGDAPVAPPRATGLI